MEHVHSLLAAWVEEKSLLARGKSLTVGLCGSQGSGKTTATQAIKAELERRGRRVAVLSLDDFYLTGSERSGLAATVHPLLKTRGVPGTHDVAMLLSTIRGLRRGMDVRVPAFDKASDDRRPREEWALVSGVVDVIILEGWCVGAVAQSDEALEQPVNDLERLEDPLGTWRGHVNRELAGRYRELTEELDYLVLLAAPSFDVVYDWRRQQENSLRKAGLKGGPITSGIMNDRALARFIAHYERLTRHILAEMPARADLVVLLDSQRRIVRTAPVLR
ncbi:MAG TPA: hypothetical protein VIC29_19185 [Steroidobacteraceae bacterium]|jgi:D-glycerate 3-kinase